MDAEDYEGDVFPTRVGELQPGNDENVKTAPFSDVKATQLSALLICSAVGVVRHALDPPLTSSHPPVVEGSELVIHSNVCTHNKSFNISSLT